MTSPNNYQTAIPQTQQPYSQNHSLSRSQIRNSPLLYSLSSYSSLVSAYSVEVGNLFLSSDLVSSPKSDGVEYLTGFPIDSVRSSLISPIDRLKESVPSETPIRVVDLVPPLATATNLSVKLVHSVSVKLIPLSNYLFNRVQFLTCYCRARFPANE